MQERGHGLRRRAEPDLRLHPAVVQWDCHRLQYYPRGADRQRLSTPHQRASDAVSRGPEVRLCTVHSSGRINVNTANRFILQSIAPLNLPGNGK